ncbi:sugar kinase [Sulfitobacter sp. D35]|uniref:sugar kinase n=1 Tax=Sulfitobacter sp. D35 TaxID=3083252 RepID=UPI00296E3674|nr:sugar kinase [Sulfitobacter sp. D35]MDW4499669.1 sugar kinase [Sulfitobacter sp. D35]
MSTRILSIGECMIEMAPSGTPGQFSMNFAGDTLNTAWYLRKLLPQGFSVEYLTDIGMDSASHKMRAFMEEHGIGTGQIRMRQDRTVGLYLIELEGAERHFSYWRGQSAARCLADDPERLADAVRNTGLVYFSGITLAILDPAGRHALLTAVEEARRHGTTVAFDPNLRPGLWDSHEEMCAAVMSAASHSDIVLPSFEDEASFFNDADGSATAQRYAGQGASLVVVKNGAGALVTLHEGETAEHTPRPVEDAVDTTAAGDSFNAAFLAEWIEKGAVAPAVARGCAVSGEVIRHRGALVALD